MSEIFLAARDLAPKERLVVLESASDGDKSLMAEVEALLAEHDRLGGFLQSPALGAHFKISQLQRPTGMGDVEAPELEERPAAASSIGAETDVQNTRDSESSQPVELQVQSSLLQQLLDRFGVVSPPPAEQASAGADSISMRLEDLAEHPSHYRRYIREDEIGRGGMGAVLRVFDRQLRRKLAMKIVRVIPQDHGSPSPREVSPTLARFLEEAQITSQLEHPGVVPVHELGLDENHQVYFTMRLVRGRSLKEILPLVHKQREGWTLTRALGVLLKVCETMSYAHDRGVIHRDLKPSNVMVGRYGEVYVMDWGLARVVGHTDLHDIRPAPEESSSIRTDLRDVRESEEDSPLVTFDGSVIGTPAYMSPEQAGGFVGDVDRRSDVYALGAMLYHLLTGQPPYIPPGSRLSPHTVLVLVLGGRPKPVHILAPEVPAELAAICERAMHRDLSGRYESMGAMADDLRAYLERRVVHAYQTGALAELHKWVVRNKPLAAALAGVVLALVVGMAGTLSMRARSERQRLIAETERSRALENERLARAETAKVLRLSDIKRLQELEAEAEGLWPAYPDKIAEMEAWLGRAEALAANLSGHRVVLSEMRAKALPYTSEDADRDQEAHSPTENLEGTRREMPEPVRESMQEPDGRALPQAKEGTRGLRRRVVQPESDFGRRRTWRFASDEDTWQHEVLAQLVRDLEALIEPNTGLLGTGVSPGHGWGVRKRLEFAQTIEDLSIRGRGASDLWAEAIASIRDRGQCPLYGGLELSPQMGLLPMGRDPQSGLWEFSHLMSGEPPRRNQAGELILDEKNAIVLVLIPGGSFWMGAQARDPGCRNYDPQAESIESPVHEVTLSPYFLSKYEMTQAQWLRITGTNPSWIAPPYWTIPWWPSRSAVSLLHPVEQVSWTACTETLGRLGLVLPTEAQWEHAARARTATPWWTGLDMESLQGAANLADAYAKENGVEGWQLYDLWLNDGSANHAPVGTYWPNPFGLHEIVGNVFEWCRDKYESYEFPVMPDDGERKADGPARGRVARGGSFTMIATYSRSAVRMTSALESFFIEAGVRPGRGITR